MAGSSRSRIVIETPERRARRPARNKTSPRNQEVWAAISIIGAAGLATFLALFLTSRPFDPANASLGPQQSVPAGPSLTPSPKTSASPTPTPTQAVTQNSPAAPGAETAPPDDAAIQSRIDKVFAADPILQTTDVSTLVENGR